MSVWAPDVRDTLVRCAKPPPDGGTAPLTPAEFQIIDNWLAFLAPNNYPASWEHFLRNQRPR